jgi:WD40 repeat protein
MVCYVYFIYDCSFILFFHTCFSSFMFLIFKTHSACAFSPTKPNMLVSASRDCSVAVWEISGKLIRKLQHPKPVSGVCFSVDGNRIFSSCWDDKVYVFDFNNGQMLSACKFVCFLCLFVCFF